MATKQDMEQWIDVLSGTRLFKGIDRSAVQNLLSCMDASLTFHKKGHLVIRAGETVTSFGILLSGGGQAFKEDLDGRPVIISLLTPGSEIGVMLAACPGRKSPVSVLACQDSVLLSVPFSSLTAGCQKACVYHDRLLSNYMWIVAEKGLMLHERIDCLLKSTVREKIMTYLLRFSQGNSGSFDLPLDRAAMAEYLHVDRSALSRELSRMKKEGLIDFYKNSFRILKKPPVIS